MAVPWTVVSGSEIDEIVSSTSFDSFLHVMDLTDLTERELEKKPGDFFGGPSDLRPPWGSLEWMWMWERLISLGISCGGFVLLDSQMRWFKSPRWKLLGLAELASL